MRCRFLIAATAAMVLAVGCTGSGGDEGFPPIPTLGLASPEEVVRSCAAIPSDATTDHAAIDIGEAGVPQRFTVFYHHFETGEAWTLLLSPGDDTSACRGPEQGVAFGSEPELRAAVEAWLSRSGRERYGDCRLEIRLLETEAEDGVCYYVPKWDTAPRVEVIKPGVSTIVALELVQLPDGGYAITDTEEIDLD